MILLISAVFPPEPLISASLANDLALALSEISEVKVLSPRPSRPLGLTYKQENVKRIEFEHIIVNSYTYPESKLAGRMYESYSFGKHVSNFITRNKPEIKCIYLNSWPLFAQYLIVKTSIKCSIPVVIHVQDIYPESLLNKLSLFKRLLIKPLLSLDKYILKNVSKIVTISPKMRSFLIKSRGLKENTVDVVFNWQDEGRFIEYRNSRGEKLHNSDFTYMFLGNINKTSALDIIISAYKESHLESSRLVIAGAGSARDAILPELNNSQGAKIELWEAPMMKVPEIQDNADILLLNLKKGAARFALPSKLPAYMFSAKPIIACVEEDTDVADIIKSANCGWIVAPEDVNKLAETMKFVYKLPKEELKIKGKNGYDYAIMNFAKAKNLKKLAEIIKRTALI